MKRVFIMGIVAVFLSTFVVVGSFAQSQGALKDGFYFAQQTGFDASSGWKSVLTFQVQGGKITSVSWNAANKKAGMDKVTYDKAGLYGMEKGGAKSAWYKQAAAAEQWLLKNQDPRLLAVSSDGKTDAISGVSIHVSDFKQLAIDALNRGPVGRGPYADGAYHAEAATFEHGYKDYVDLTVIGGRIVAAYWSAYAQAGGDDKYVVSVKGNYGLEKSAGAKGRWDQEADRAVSYLLANQSLASLSIKSDGSTDAISGCTITVTGFQQLVQTALKNGPVQ